MKIFYMPLEPYPERYTVQLSRAGDGWLERNWNRYGIPYVRVDGVGDALQTYEVRTGQVLDAIGRPNWSLQQMRNLLAMIERGEVHNGDCIYFDDFWHPGFSALPYVRQLLNLDLRIYGMIHAQSVDEFDFTYPMRSWMRHFEKGIGECYDGIFVTSTGLRDLLIKEEVASGSKIHICGLPYNSEEVKEHFPKKLPDRKLQVVWSSRWDKEKDPGFFLKVVDYVYQALQGDRSWEDLKFIVSTGQKELKSNDPKLLDLLSVYLNKYPKRFLELKFNSTKAEYYNTLLSSAIQFNCADQDWVSWTLLEATTCGCIPVYPNFKSFPECIPEPFLYEKGNVQDAGDTVIERLVEFRNYRSNVAQQPHYFKRVQSIYQPYDDSWWRMYRVMRKQSDFFKKDWGLM